MVDISDVNACMKFSRWLYIDDEDAPPADDDDQASLVRARWIEEGDDGLLLVMAFRESVVLR